MCIGFFFALFLRQDIIVRFNPWPSKAVSSHVLPNIMQSFLFQDVVLIQSNRTNSSRKLGK